MPDGGIGDVGRGGQSQREGLHTAVHAVTVLAPELDDVAIAEILWLAAVREGPSPSAREPAGGHQEAAVTGSSDSATQPAPAGAQPAVPPSDEPVDNPAPASSGVDSATTREVYENIAGAPRGTAVSGRSFSTPRGSALPRSLELGRALRPFKRAWAPGPRRVLDIEATARDYAQSGELLPTLRAQPERFLDLALVVDRSPSMAVWHEVAEEFTTVLHRLGAFKRVRTWDLRMDESGRPLLRAKNTARAAARNSPPAGLTGPRSQVIVLSDCSADGWYQPEIWRLLYQWGAAVPTTMVNPLPSRLWRLTGLDLPAVRVTNPGAAVVHNTRLDYRRPWHLRFGADADVPLTPLPVAMLTPYGLESWARVLMSAGTVGGADFVGCDAVLVPRHGRFEDEFVGGLVEGFADGDDPMPAEELIAGFLTSASPLAARLAVMCAPYTRMTMPLLHLVRQTMVPEATLEEVAEVVVSGLFTTSSAEDGSPVLHPRPGVQAGLEELLGADDTWRMYEALTQYVAAHAGSLSALSAAIRDPSGDVGLPAELRPFAAATVDTLRVLGALPPALATRTVADITVTGGMAGRAGSGAQHVGLGKIIVFHASAPGIGTSSTIVSAAWILASHGKRVLLAEWLPEPPSVAHYLEPFLEEPEEFSHDGLPPTVAVDWDFPESGSLDYLPDGFAPYDIHPSALRETLRSGYDYVLVLIADWNRDPDATAALTTLPDTVVTCFRVSDPVIRDRTLSLLAGIDPPRQVFPLPMGIQKDSRQSARAYARAAFVGLPNGLSQSQIRRYWDTTGIPYRAARAFKGIPAVFIDTPDLRDSVLAAVETLVGWITGGAISALPQLHESKRQQILARYARLGRSPLATPSEALTDPIPSVSLTDLLGIRDLENLGEPWLNWLRDRLRVPIGIDIAGQTVTLDLNEAAAGGMGPHGVVVGEAGSGKSELLRTMVTGLATAHSPDTLTFALVDPAGDGTFAEMAGLPHISALITNLLDDLPLVDRMTEALNGELQRRQELLLAGGDYIRNYKDYKAARERGASLAPLPALLVVIDEFAEVLARRPDLIEPLVRICRAGRSLGVHLLLASRRLEEGRLRGLDTFLSYRIGLRTFSASESRAVIGVPDASELPPAPGSAYLRTGTEPPQRFKAAYVSETGVIEVLTTRLAGAPFTHQIWVPPLDEPVTLDAVMPPLDRDRERGLCVIGWGGNGQLATPLGWVDKPFQHRKDLLWADFAGARGHALVTGGPQSGKSTLVRTLISSLALTHTAEEVQFIILDVGAPSAAHGPLSSLLRLPHISGYTTSDSGERVRRSVGELTTLLAEREELFARYRLDSIAAYRERRGELREPRNFGDVFLVIDDWPTLLRDYEQLEEPITKLIERGLGYGIHVVLTADHTGQVPLADAFGTKLELRLKDPFQSEVNRRMAADIPAATPGRGLTSDKLHFLGALPRIDGETSATTDRRGTEELVRQISDAWPGPAAPKVRLLPSLVTATEVRAPMRVRRTDNPSVPFGLSEADLQPVSTDFRRDPHFLVFGDAESGKTSFLRTLAAGIMTDYTPEQATIAVIDYRRGLVDAVTNDYLLSYADTESAAMDMIASCAEGMERRLPGPDTTAAQLRDRSWWPGPELFVLVDDYELVAVPGSRNPLSPLLEYLAQGRDIGLHLVTARASVGAARGLFEPVLQRMRELGSPGLVLSGDEVEGPLVGPVKPSPQPPGRGVLVHRRMTPGVVQVAWTPPGNG